MSEPTIEPTVIPEGVEISVIVAVSENGVIGKDGDMPWRLRSDLMRFKKLTMGHSIIMGRKTYESIGRLLPGRTTVILTRQTDYRVQGAVVVASLEEALAATEDQRPFVVGGAEIYRIALPLASRLYLTRVLEVIDGDTVFPEFDSQQWELESQEAVSGDDRDSHATKFEVYRRTPVVTVSQEPLS